MDLLHNQRLKNHNLRSNDYDMAELAQPTHVLVSHDFSISQSFFFKQILCSKIFLMAKIFVLIKTLKGRVLNVPRKMKCQIVLSFYSSESQCSRFSKMFKKCSKNVLKTLKVCGLKCKGRPQSASSINDAFRLKF